MTALPPGSEVEVVTWGDVRVGDWVVVYAVHKVLEMGASLDEPIYFLSGGRVVARHATDPCHRLIPSASSRVLDAAQATIAELRAELAKYKNESEPWEQT